jgi:hypothetical protein
MAAMGPAGQPLPRVLDTVLTGFRVALSESRVSMTPLLPNTDECMTPSNVSPCVYVLSSTAQVANGWPAAWEVGCWPHHSEQALSLP